MNRRILVLVALVEMLPAAAWGQEIRFSRPGGTFTDGFPLALSAGSSNAVIHYGWIPGLTIIW